MNETPPAECDLGDITCDGPAGHDGDHYFWYDGPHYYRIVYLDDEEADLGRDSDQ